MKTILFAVFLSSLIYSQSLESKTEAQKLSELKLHQVILVSDIAIAEGRTIIKVMRVEGGYIYTTLYTGYGKLSLTRITSVFVPDKPILNESLLQ